MKSRTAFILTVILSACASMAPVTYEPDPAKFGRAKRVAVVGFQLVQDDEGLKESNYVNDPVSEILYTEFAASLKSQFKWEVVSLDDLKNHPDYQRLYIDEPTRAFKLGFSLTEDRAPARYYHAKGLGKPNSIVFLDLKQREALKSALHVDHFIVAQLWVKNHGAPVTVGLSFGADDRAKALRRSLAQNVDPNGAPGGVTIPLGNERWRVQTKLFAYDEQKAGPFFQVVNSETELPPRSSLNEAVKVSVLEVKRNYESALR